MTKHQGLTHKEVEERLAKHGTNEIIRQKAISPLKIFISQFTNILVYLLFAAAIFSFFLHEYLDAYLILTIIILNGIFGYVQEFKAEKAIEALKKIAVSVVKVIRDGEEAQIDSKQLVPGDIVLLEEGDKVPADAKLLESRHIQVNEAALTGESAPVEKSADNEQANMIWMGTIITRGRATAEIMTTGMQTRFGKIAAGLSEIEEEQTPLEKKVASLGKILGLFAVVASGGLLVVGLLRGFELTLLIITSISLAVAAVPEGLPAVITITLALGTQRMVKRKAILRKLQAIESLGSLTVIATDKTGTLTKNEMHVSKLWMDGDIYAHDDTSLATNSLFAKLMQIGIRANTANVVLKNLKERIVIGDSTEGALLMLAEEYKQNTDKIRSQGRLEEEYSFDADRKTMGVVWHDGAGKHETEILIKGAPEVIIQMSKQMQTADGVKPLNAAHKKDLEDTQKTLAKEGLRLLALAYKPVKAVPKDRDSAESDLILVGIVGINDPARPEVKPAIEAARLAGIRTLMVTGDNPITASTIGHAVGLDHTENDIITGDAFEALSDADAMKQLDHLVIFARTAPEQKLRIVRLLQKKGNIVGVTGDGINDSLALKQADVGVAMGITGTDVAKETADMIITDDNYATIVSAIEEGRIIYENMKSSVKYLVGCNIGEVLSLIAGIMMGWPLIMTPIQILYINLATDGLPALGLAAIPTHGNIMKQKPHQKQTVFERHDIFWLAETSLLMMTVTLIAFAAGLRIFDDVVIARTLAFTTSIFAQQFVFLDLQARDLSFFASLTKANKLPYLALLPVLLQLFIVYIGPVEHIFDVTEIPGMYFAATIALASVLLVVSEIRKRYASVHFYPPKTQHGNK